MPPVTSLQQRQARAWIVSPDQPPGPRSHGWFRIPKFLGKELIFVEETAEFALPRGDLVLTPATCTKVLDFLPSIHLVGKTMIYPPTVDTPLKKIYGVEYCCSSEPVSDSIFKLLLSQTSPIHLDAIDNAKGIQNK